MDAIGYIRRSKATKHTKHDVVSLDAQRDAIVTYCQKNNFTLKDILSHDGISGTKRIRFAEIERSVLDAGAQVLVIYNLDRLARDSKGLQEHFEKIYSAGIKVHETTGGEVPYKRAMDRFMVRVRAAMDQLYAELVGEKTADALRFKKENSQRYTNIPPFGYFYQDGRLIPHPEEQKALVVIGECREQKLGARRTVRRLLELGYKGRQGIATIHRALRERSVQS